MRGRAAAALLQSRTAAGAGLPRVPTCCWRAKAISQHGRCQELGTTGAASGRQAGQQAAPLQSPSQWWRDGWAEQGRAGRTPHSQSTPKGIAFLPFFPGCPPFSHAIGDRVPNGRIVWIRGVLVGHHPNDSPPAHWIGADISGRGDGQGVNIGFIHISDRWLAAHMGGWDGIKKGACRSRGRCERSQGVAPATHCFILAGPTRQCRGVGLAELRHTPCCPQFGRRTGTQPADSTGTPGVVPGTRPLWHTL